MTDVIPIGRAEPVSELARLAAHLDLSTAASVVVADDLVVSASALAPLTDDPFASTTLLVRPATTDADVRVRHHVVTSVGSQFHDVTAPDHRSVGALLISSSDASSAAAVILELRSAIDDGSIRSDGTDLVELVAVCLLYTSPSPRD